MTLWSTAAAKRLLVALLTFAFLGGAACATLFWMPGNRFQGALPPLDSRETALRAELFRDVTMLAGAIGERNLDTPEAYVRAASWIESELAAAGYAPRREPFTASGEEVWNVVAERKGGARTGELVVLGAHYDSVQGSPGANDNGSGVAALLALARRFANEPAERTLRFVAFANEEPPYFQADGMGSDVHARGCKARGENLVAMISLETMGYFSDAPGSQHYPMPLFALLYPTTGNYIGFIGNTASRALIRRLVGSFRAGATVPSEGAAVPEAVPGVGWSDHWAFWKIGVSAVMVTDTAPFRYPHYHEATDTPDKIDYDRLARVVRGLEGSLAELAGGT